MDTEIIDKLFLELSQFTKAKTSKEAQAEADKIIVKKIIKNNEQLQAENKRLTQYKDYVESRINENTLPKPYGEWNKVVEDLAKELHHKKSRPVSGKN